MPSAPSSVANSAVSEALRVRRYQGCGGGGCGLIWEAIEVYIEALEEGGQAVPAPWGRTLMKSRSPTCAA